METPDQNLRNPNWAVDLTPAINSTGFFLNPIPGVTDAETKAPKMRDNLSPSSSTKSVDYPNNAPSINNPKKGRQKKPQKWNPHPTPYLPNLHSTTTGTCTGILAGDSPPWPGTKLLFSTGKPAQIPYHSKASTSGQGNRGGPKKGLGDVWISALEIDGAPDHQSLAAIHRPTISSQHDATDLQFTPFLPGSGNGGSLCDSPVQGPPHMATPRPFVFNAGEAELPNIGEHLQGDIKGAGYPKEP
ncbi:hypothetical protein A4A49_05792 [Nicotiana attenuata]|uniref:Uncharacterized protein n=1 Tax=Nicotiana attenuata TaxID=49451 RepID=A0A1J6IMS6_NICAT|nr:hypothetical protein A4A49_05792 [Nicotiana attenuata]